MEPTHRIVTFDENGKVYDLRERDWNTRLKNGELPSDERWVLMYAIDEMPLGGRVEVQDLREGAEAARMLAIARREREEAIADGYTQCLMCDEHANDCVCTSPVYKKF